MATTGPGTLARFLTLFAALFGGAPLGVGLASWVAPDSEAAAVVSFVLLPLGLFLGFHLWLGAALIWALSRLAVNIARRRRLREGMPEPTEPPRGSFAFVPCAGCVATLGGAVVGALSKQAGVVSAALLYGLVGLGYGMALWGAARRGYLPFPEEG